MAALSVIAVDSWNYHFCVFCKLNLSIGGELTLKPSVAFDFNQLLFIYLSKYLGIPAKMTNFAAKK
jgi:hypothetical protein